MRLFFALLRQLQNFAVAAVLLSVQGVVKNAPQYYDNLMEAAFAKALQIIWLGVRTPNPKEK
jgi:hypothetical protein